MKQWYTLYSNILYLHFTKQFYLLPESAKNAASPQNPLLRFLRVVGYTFVRLIGNLFQNVEKPEKMQGKVWLYVVSQNNYDSLQFVQQGLPDAVFVAGQSKNIGKYNKTVERISLRRKIIYYYKFPMLLLQFLKHNRKSTLRFYDLLYDAIGFYEVYYHKLKRHKPSAVVFANDHNADARAMLLAAKALGIKTSYIQHSSISSLFPPLTFDLNLLEGQDSLEKYRQCGPVQGRVELVGMPKADAYVPFRNKNNTIRTIGIGCNLMDLTEELEKVVRMLTECLPDIFITIRPHPRDKRDFNYITKNSPKIEFSYASQESAFDYLRRLDVQISGNSGIHLEAVLLNVWSIFFNFNTQENLYDYYGFMKNGLVDEATSAPHLCQMLQEHINARPDVYERSKYYNATVGTTYDGKSGELALNYLNDFLRQ
jgi:hypothetical protein